MKRPVYIVLLVCTALLFYGRGLIAGEEYTISSYDSHLNGGYLICNGRNLKGGANAFNIKNRPFPVLQLGPLTVFKGMENPALNRLRCNDLVLLYQPEDASRHSCLPQRADDYFESRFYSGRTLYPLRWYVNLPQPNGIADSQKVLKVHEQSDSTTFLILPVSGLAGDMLAFDLIGSHTDEFSVAQALLLEQIFYDFLVSRLTTAVYEVESPLQFLSSASVPVYMPDFMVRGKRPAMEKLLKNWSRVEDSILRNLTVDYLKTIQRNLDRQLTLYTSEPLPRLTVMIKLLLKFGYIHPLNELQKQIAAEDMSLFLKKVAAVFRHTKYHGFWITGGKGEQGLLPEKYIVKVLEADKSNQTELK